MGQDAFYSCGARPAGTTLVRLSQTAFLRQSCKRGIDVGASQLLIDGKIKLKNDSQLARFTQNGLEFTDGSTLDADAVVFATG
jgi:hypothetical protein